MNIKNVNYSQIKNRLWLTLVAIVFTLTSCVHNKKDSLNTQISHKNTQQDPLPETGETSSPKTENTAGETNLVRPISEKVTTLSNSTIKQVAKEKDVLTIWVHGTRSVGLQDSIFKNFFYRKTGLHAISEYLQEHKFTQLGKRLSEQNTPRFEFDNFYVYGWSGQLSHKARKIAAKDLHKAILEIIADYKNKHNKNNITPKIRIITHSHGGNVALNMAKINKLADNSNKIAVHELVLLACPVQQKTAHFISDSMFEKIYSLYSQMDMLQVIDPQGLHKHKKKEKKPLFSERTFTPSADMPEQKLTQAKIVINSRGILHVEFITEKFAKLLPHILQELDAWDMQEKAQKQNPVQAQEKATGPQKTKATLKCLRIHVNKKNTLFYRKYLKNRNKKGPTS